MKRVPLRRKGGLRRRAPIKARSKGALISTYPDREGGGLMAHTRAMAQARARGRCEDGCGRPGDDPHHIFPKQKWPELADEIDNILWVSRHCHANHEVASHRLPRYAVRRAYRLARTDSMRAYLDRTYEDRPLP